MRLTGKQSLRPDLPLHGRTAVVTGGSRGVGKGIALELIAGGANVVVTGRSPDDLRYLDGRGTAILCDHRDDRQVEAAFQRVLDERGRIDVLVNNVWGGYENMVEGNEFTWTKPFWEQPRWRWDAMMTAGVRAAFVASQLAARLMVPAGRGLIVNVSHWAAQKHIGNALYGVAKAATDKLSADAAHELRPHGVAAVSLYPGLVRTEAVLAAGVFDLSNSESPEFVGRAVGALAADPQVMRWSGRVVVAAALAREYGFADVDGRRPASLRRRAQLDQEP